MIFWKRVWTTVIELYSQAYFSIVELVMEQVAAGELIEQLLVVCAKVSRADTSRYVDKLISGDSWQLNDVHLVYDLTDNKDLGNSGIA